MSRFTVHDLAATIDARAASGGEASYTKKLLDKGAEHCAKKLGEEAVEAGFFCERDELVWGDKAPLRMLPAGKCLKSAEEAGAKLDERLKIRDDLVIFERSAQIVCVVGSHG